MFPLQGPRFGKIHVLGSEVNPIAKRRYEEVSILYLGEITGDILVFDEPRLDYWYSSLPDGRGILITNRQAPHLEDFYMFLENYKRRNKNESDLPTLSEADLADAFVTKNLFLGERIYYYG